ncbi:COP9 signalosome complex subunit 6 [Tribolium castaneum]|uniref:COP9 signalosome complex subunit 6 n=1 Tax=Tribolium castaneum TaxID=7070 RepID=D7EJD7_TRICA|nr:PREDICTED: COP9 signalosome complex subunit 6 [Tribolium castaneum]EFA12663.1 COP9 signalosome complex subunit 6-like Protein [Tribolium castaneum]|eukprot:XP_973281.1 PREDICTED: COP9 signalosome complex subunit 6 [Tribolium castaneum]
MSTKESMEMEVDNPASADVANNPAEDSEKSVMAAGAVGSVTCSLHPLVIMNVSEHWTREKAQEGSVQRVIGALIGKQKGRNIEIMNSFELVFSVIGGDVIIDRDYYNMKEEQFKQVFSDMDFIGWYTTGDIPNTTDIKIHKQICDINESPILLKLNPYDKNIDHLPVALYESVIDLIGGEATMLFVNLSYTLATEEAERIGVDHVARMSSTDSGESSLVAEHLTAQHSAIKMLHSRVRLVLEYMKAVQSGQLPTNHEILREAYSLCHRLPVIQSARFRQDFYNQCNDVGLMTYLGTLTKGCNDLNQFVNKFNILYDRQGLGRRMRGIFF